MIQLQIRKPKSVRAYPNSYILRFCKNPECGRPFYTRTKPSHVLPAGVRKFNAKVCSKECSYKYLLEKNRLRAQKYRDKMKK
jgi:hypothetical protein